MSRSNPTADKTAYDATLEKLAGLFAKNFTKFSATAEGQRLVQAGPK